MARKLTARRIADRMNCRTHIMETLTLRERHPYCEAERLFTSGRIPVAQAVGMMLTDIDYRAECELSGRDARVYAECIVRDQWARRLLEVSHG